MAEIIKTADNILQEAGIPSGDGIKGGRKRALARGLTLEYIAWNRKLGRPLDFVEGDRAVEAKRRAEWTAKEKDLGR